MKHTKTNIGPCKIEVKTEVEKKEFDVFTEKAFEKVSSTVVVKGFRAGKAPKELLAKHVDQTKVLDEAYNQAIQAAFAEIVSKEGIRPMYQPNVEPLKAEKEGIAFKFTFITFPTVKLGSYKGLTAKKEAPSVKDEEVEEAIKALLNRNAMWEKADKAAEMGDTVVLDFEGFIDGKAFEGGKGENHSLELGSKTFIPGFEEALVGVKEGESKDIEVTFPAQYVAELANKKATFKCVVHEIKAKKVPELNDGTVKDLGISGVETVEALKNNQKEQILTRKLDESNKAYYDAIVAQIVKGSTIEIAGEIIDQEAARNEEETKKRIQGQGLTFEQYLQIIGKKEEELKKELRKSTEENLKTFLCLEQIAVEEKLNPTDKDVKAEIAKMAEMYKMKVEEIEKILNPQMDNFKSNLRGKMVQDFILANNK